MNFRLKLGTILAGSAIAAATTLGSAGAATNLLTNGDLRPTTAGWNVSGVGTFTTIPGIGGKLTSTEATMSETSVVAQQCVAVQSNHTYQFSGSHRIPADQGRGGFMFYLARFYSGPGCTGSIPDQMMSSHYSESTGWGDLSMDLTRNSGEPVQSVSINLVVKKDATNRFIKKGEPFTVHFKSLSLTGTPNPGGPVACVAFGGECGEEEEPEVPGDGPAVCIGCEDDPEDVPPPAAEEPPSLEPLEPAIPDSDDQPAPDAPDSSDEPGADSPDAADEPVGDDAPSSEENPARPSTTGGGRPTSTGGSQPSSGDNAPSKQPTLQPAPQDNSIDAATPTPGAPATGGDSTSDPASDLDYGDDQSEPVGPPNIGPSNNEPVGLPMPAVAGGAFAVGLAALLLGIMLRRVYRR